MPTITNLISITQLVSLCFFILLIWGLVQIFFLLYHLLRFGIGTAPKSTAVFFFFGSIAVFSLVLLANWQVNWQGLIENIKHINVQSLFRN